MIIKNLPEVYKVANNQIKGHVFKLVLFFLFVVLVPYILEFLLGLLTGSGVIANQIVSNTIFYVGHFIIITISTFLMLGYYYVYVALSRGFEPEFKDIFAMFNSYWGFKAIGLMFYIALRMFCSLIPFFIVDFVFKDDFGNSPLWTIIFLIPLIPYYISYAAVIFVFLEEMWFSNFEIVKKSKDVMKGNKMKFLSLFIVLALYVSFILYMVNLIDSFFIIILAALLLIRLIPYSTAVHVNFYNYISYNDVPDIDSNTNSIFSPKPKLTREMIANMSTNERINEIQKLLEN